MKALTERRLFLTAAATLAALASMPVTAHAAAPADRATGDQPVHHRHRGKRRHAHHVRTGLRSRGRQRSSFAR
ncbi:hypothetical protein RB200_10820 [Streptomyces sp. PmtG]